MLHRLVVAWCVAILPGQDAAPAAQDRSIRILQSWDGIVADDALLKEAPRSGVPGEGKAGFITDEKNFARLWHSWRGKQPLPKIDFRMHLVLVFTLGGPNKIADPTLALEADGNLIATAVATLIGGDGFCYKLAVIPRAGVRRVNLTPVP